MSIRIVPSALRPVPLTALLLVLSLVAACDLRGPVNPPDLEVNPPHLSVVARLVIDVDPQTGVVVPRAQAATGSGGPALSLAPVDSDAVRVSVSCDGCGDGQVGWEILTVRFTMLDGSLQSSWVDFRRDHNGEASPVMTCGNCDVRWTKVTPLPMQLEAGDVFEVVVGVLSREPRPFSIGFDLVSREIQMPARVLELHPPGATRSWAIAINNRGEVLIGSDAGHFIWSAETGFRAIPESDWQAMNDAGHVVGTRGSHPATEAVFWPGSGPVRVLALPAEREYANANDINNAGIIVGKAGWRGTDGFQARQSIRWESATTVGEPLHGPNDAINDVGDVVGVIDFIDGFYPRYSLWTAGEDRGSPGGLDINNAGQTIRTYPHQQNEQEWVQSRFWSPESGDSNIGPSRMSVTSNALNNHGLVVGKFRHGFGGGSYEWGPDIPFHWAAGREMEPLELPDGFEGGAAIDVNDFGQIAGTAFETFYYGGQTPRAVLWEPITP